MNGERASKSEIFCWCIWTACFIWNLAMIVVQGVNWPWSDEWNFVPYLTGARPITLGWLWAQHADHRIPLDKALYWIFSVISPGDFRMPLYFCALLMAVTSAILIVAAKRLRGYSSFADAFFPLFMMHMGLHAWYWGGMMNFLLSSVVMCFIMSVWATALRTGKKSLDIFQALSIVLALLMLPLIGNNGLALSFGVILFVVFLIFLHTREPDQNLPVLAILGSGVALSMCLIGAYFYHYARVKYDWGALGLFSFCKMVLLMFIAPLGTKIAGHEILALSIGIVACSFLFFRMAQFISRDENGDRFYFIGFLILLLSQIMLAVAIGYGRAAHEWSAEYFGHYAFLMVPFFIGIYLLAVRMRMRIFTFLMLFMAICVFVIYVPDSVEISRNMWLKYRAEDAVLAASKNIDDFVRKETINLFFIDNQEARGYVREGVLDLSRQSKRIHRGVLSKFIKFSQQ